MRQISRLRVCTSYQQYNIQLQSSIRLYAHLISFVPLSSSEYFALIISNMAHISEYCIEPAENAKR